MWMGAAYICGRLRSGFRFQSAAGPCRLTETGLECRVCRLCTDSDSVARVVFQQQFLLGTATAARRCSPSALLQRCTTVPGHHDTVNLRVQLLQCNASLSYAVIITHRLTRAIACHAHAAPATVRSSLVHHMPSGLEAKDKLIYWAYIGVSNQWPTAS